MEATSIGGRCSEYAKELFLSYFAPPIMKGLSIEPLNGDLMVLVYLVPLIRAYWLDIYSDICSLL